MSRASRVTGIVVAFALGLILLEVLARIVISATDADEIVWYDASTQLRVEMLDEIGDVETVFAGTSSAWQGLVPEVFVDEGTTQSAFNVGLAGGVPAVTSPWLLDEVVPRADPDVVVWGLTSLDFSTSYGDVNEEAYDEAFETRDGWLSDVDRAVSDVSELVGSRRLLRSPSMLWGQGQDDVIADFSEAEVILGPSGQRLDFTENTSSERAAIMQARVRDYEIDRRDVELVRSAIADLQAQGRTVVLVELPFPDRFVALHPNGADDIAAAGQVIDDLGAELGVRVLRTTEAFSDDDFVDFSHLDSDAARRFSTDIARQLG